MQSLKSVQRTMNEKNTLKEKLYEIIFGTDTRAGNTFDVLLILAIVISVTIVILDSVQPYHENHGELFLKIEWFFTLLFSLEYLLRLYCSPQPKKYATSFFGIIDLLAILPTYIGLFLPSVSYLISIRILRVLRVFRVLRLFRYLGEANVLIRSMLMARRKIFIFLFSVLLMIIFFGSLMFIIEGPENGFTSIPRSMYWAIVTITTVGYGDITPQTILGQSIAAMAMITGYAIIAVPTGIITAELAQEIRKTYSSTLCDECNRGGHESDAKHCKFCGQALDNVDHNDY